MSWKAEDKLQVNKRIQAALEENINFRKSSVFGLPATFLDEVEFYDDAPFLEDAPFLKTFIANPNHIGCHTLGDSESFFRGTQKIEKELIQILAEDIFKAPKEGYDGYVSAGGTEANIQAMWVYRNFFKETKGLKNDEIVILTSEDSHYSVDKAANLLAVDIVKLKVDPSSRQIVEEELEEVLQRLKKSGKKAIIVQLNMGTTMFGSIDDIDQLVPYFIRSEMDFKIHIDAAFGGFIYPFSKPDQPIHFQNPYVSSISLDAHKMLQAPYGTGVFLVKKGMIQYTQTASATYVKGLDFTLSGSRSGANAVAVWMILKRYGSTGWANKVKDLIEMTDVLSAEFESLGISFFRAEGMNIITFLNESVSEKLRSQYNIVSDGKHSKIVVMPHVTKEKIDLFINILKHESVSGTV